MMDFSKPGEWIKYGSFVLVLICFFMVFLKVLYEMRVIRDDSLVLRIKNNVFKHLEKLSIKPFLKWIHNKKELRLFLGFMLMVVGSRILIYIVGYLFHYYNKHGNFHFILDFEQLWKKWDSHNYVYTAEHGYTTEGDKKYYIAFFPFYPVLIRLVALIVQDYYLASLVVSNIALTTASYFLYKLCLLDYNEKVAFGAVWYMLIFPFSVFLGLAFTESVFLALTIAFFYLLRKQEWLWAGFIGLLAAFSKNQGALLMVPYMIEVLISLRIINDYHLRNKHRLFFEFMKKTIPIILIPTGLGIYLLINKIVTGDWFTFFKYLDEHWSQRIGFLGDVIRQNLDYMGSWNDMLLRITVFTPQIILFIIGIILVLYGIKRMRGSYLAYTMAYISLVYSATWLISGPRYFLCLFPIYILISIVTNKNRYLNFTVTFTSLILLGYYTINYIEDALL